MLNCTSWEQHCNLQRGFRDAAGVEQAAKAKLPRGPFPIHCSTSAGAHSAEGCRGQFRVSLAWQLQLLTSAV